jgi:hypothetical protein
MEKEVLVGFAFFVISAPILSLSIRLALRPMIDAVFQLRSAFDALSPSRPTSEFAQLARLNEEVADLCSQLHEVNEGLRFERQLQPVGRPHPDLTGTDLDPHV